MVQINFCVFQYTLCYASVTAILIFTCMHDCVLCYIIITCVCYHMTCSNPGGSAHSVLSRLLITSGFPRGDAKRTSMQVA